jgi:hypothetical protein
MVRLMLREHVLVKIMHRNESLNNIINILQFLAP